jgi:hypothetical protein
MAVAPLDCVAPASLTEFGAYFASARHSAFRLEMLEYFTIPEEQPFFQRYLAGEKRPPAGFNAEWTSLIRNATQRNAAFTRVRLVRTPYHDYLKFEAAWGYSTNLAAGENIRVLKHTSLPFETQVPVLKDFWLFDDSTCFLMEYDFIGRFLGASRVHEKFVELYVALQRELLNTSQPVQESELWHSVV